MLNAWIKQARIKQARIKQAMFAGVAIASLTTIAPAHAQPRSPAPQGWRDLLQGWFNRGGNDDENEQRNISRPGVGICLPAVNSGEVLSVWSDRPMLLWQGELSRVNLRGNGDRLFSQPIEPGSDRVTVPFALQPGVQYNWTLINEREGERENAAAVPFQVMAATDRDRITADLAALTAPNTSPEAIALAQTQYFLDRQLRADALQVMASIESPSPELSELLQSIVDQSCAEPLRSPEDKFIDGVLKLLQSFP